MDYDEMFFYENEDENNNSDWLDDDMDIMDFEDD